MAQIRAWIVCIPVLVLVACKEKTMVWCLGEKQLNYAGAIKSDTEDLLRPVLSGRGAILRDSNTNSFQRVTLGAGKCDGRVLNYNEFYELAASRNLQKDAAPEFCALTYRKRDLKQTPGNLTAYLNLSGLRRAESSGQDNLTTFVAAESCELLKAVQKFAVPIEPVKVQAGKGDVSYFLDSDIRIKPEQP
jgi:hypothetical protein